MREAILRYLYVSQILVESWDKNKVQLPACWACTYSSIDWVADIDQRGTWFESHSLHYKYLSHIIIFTFFDLGIGVVDDGEEHVNEYEEDEEDVCYEEYWSQDSVRFFNHLEIEVTQDNTEQSKSMKMKNCTRNELYWYDSWLFCRKDEI